jgi:hypothetical protein
MTLRRDVGDRILFSPARKFGRLGIAVCDTVRSCATPRVRVTAWAVASNVSTHLYSISELVTQHAANS